MPLLIAQDTFDRTLTDTWGSAPLGGTYSLSGVATRYSVSGGKGIIAVATGGVETAYLNAISSDNTHIRASMSSSTGYLGGPQSFSVGARTTPAGIYQARARIEDGLLRLYVLRDETALGASTAITHTYVAGQVIWLDVRAIGTSPTTISAKMWVAGTDEPTSYQQVVTDSTEGMQVAGGITLRAAIGGSPSSTPVMAYEEMSAWDPTITPLATPTVTLTFNNPTQIGGSNGRITATWPAVPGASGYESALVQGVATSGFVADDTSATSPKTYSNLGPGTYTVAVRAKAGV